MHSQLRDMHQKTETELRAEVSVLRANIAEQSRRAHEGHETSRKMEIALRTAQEESHYLSNIAQLSEQYAHYQRDSNVSMEQDCTDTSSPHSYYTHASTATPGMKSKLSTTASGSDCRQQRRFQHHGSAQTLPVAAMNMSDSIKSHLDCGSAFSPASNGGSAILQFINSSNCGTGSSSGGGIDNVLGQARSPVPVSPASSLTSNRSNINSYSQNGDSDSNHETTIGVYSMLDKLAL